MGLLNKRKPQIREKRLNTLSAYYGDINQVLNSIEEGKTNQKIRTFSQASFDEIIYILQALNGIEDAGIIIHGPLGCSSVQLNILSKRNSRRWIVTNLNEKDSILGSGEKLELAIRKLYKSYKPNVIFIVATPVIAINNDDILSPIIELEDVLNIKIVPIFSDGFKSKTRIYGSDIVFHAICKYLVTSKKEETQSNLINLISISESEKELDEIKNLLNKIGIEVNVLPQFSTLENIYKIPKAALSVSIDKDQGDYFVKSLEEKYQIPFLLNLYPMGIQGTSNWLISIGKALGLEKNVETVIFEYSDDLKEYINKNKLNGLRVYINLPTSKAFSVVKLIKELEGSLAGITVDHIDDLNKEDLIYIEKLDENIKFHVANGQPFEEESILSKLNPDLYIGLSHHSVLAGKLGIPSVAIDNLDILGFNGIKNLVKTINKAIKNKKFVEKLAKADRLPYNKNWYNRSINWYIKQEVK
ncbi:nitrogenase component 1 [Clostridium sp. WILCCON 0269]|uniref:Nitrogenase component 1 n=1 Tax=Candidatus Clostridium eludens TaxID=3381663 RepID=A0ABW8SJA5_9CLOT